MVEQLIGNLQITLGKHFDTCIMEITVEKYKVKCLLLLRKETWNRKQKRFNYFNAACLIDNIIVAVPVCLWLQWNLLPLTVEFIQLLRMNHKQHARKKDFITLFQENDKMWLDPTGK